MKRIFALMFILLLTVPALAQDDFVDPVAVETAAATVEAPAPVDTTPAPSDDPAITLKWWQVIAGLFTAAAGGGAIGILGFAVIANRIRNDAATMAAIEGLAKSVPADVAKGMLDLAKATQAVATLVEETFDGIPASSKPTPAGSAAG